MFSIKEDWNTAAKAYEEFNNSPDSYSYNIEWPCIKELLPDMNGKTILDLGCGTGIFTFLLEQHIPARLVGIDLSEEMLEIANKKAVDRKSIAQFHLGDAEKFGDYTNDVFDLIFSSTMTHYIENLDMFFENISKCLKSEGICVLSVIHPVYSAMYPVENGDAFPTDEQWAVRYLDHGKRSYIQPWIEYNDDYVNQLSRSYHHTFGDYVNAIVNAGLCVKKVREPMPPECWKNEAFARYDHFIETPTYMIFVISK